MSLLDITGIAEVPPSWQGNVPARGPHLQINRYCAVTEAVLSGFLYGSTRFIAPIEGDPTNDRQLELLAHVNVYMSAGREKDALGVRTPLVFWLVMCGWTTPQRVLSAMASENAGAIKLEDLTRLFSDRWILDSMLGHWHEHVDRGQQREYTLTAARPGAKGGTKLIKNRGGKWSINRDQFTVDEFTAAATDWNQRQGHLRKEQCEQVTNEPALPALLSRPQIFKLDVAFEGYQEQLVTRQRWTDLVKYTFRALVDRHAGPATARQVFEGISKGLDWFRQEAKR